MRPPLSALEGRTFDVIVIGGGAAGASASQHIAARGYDTLLVDKGDFASGTSSRSSRLLYCGLAHLSPDHELWRYIYPPRDLIRRMWMARLAMESQSRLTGETVNLAIAKGADVVQVAQVDSRFVLGSREWVGVDVPAHCSALGKILYAFEALPMAREPLAAPTPHTVASVADLTEQCTQARRRGYATAVDELEIGLCAVAVPILGGRGRALAALGVSGPADRLVDQFDRVAELLRQHSAVVAKRLSTHHKEGAA